MDIGIGIGIGIDIYCSALSTLTLHKLSTKTVGPNCTGNDYVSNRAVKGAR